MTKFAVNTQQRRRRWLAILASMLFFVNCVKDPAGPETPDPATAPGIYVINEGLFGQDNSTITFFSRPSGQALHDYFAAVNPGLRLGDTATSLTLHRDRLYIVVNGSNTIEVIERVSGKSLGRIVLSEQPSPRQAVIANDTTGFVTALLTDEVIVFHPLELRELGRIKVGPAPEGLAIANNRLFVANSGLGDIRAAEDGAGTLSAVSLSHHAEVGRIPAIYNPTNVQTGSDGLLYVAGTGSYQRDDVISGILVIEPGGATVLDTVVIGGHPGKFALTSDGFGYVLTDEAVVKFSTTTRTVVDSVFVRRSQLGADAWLYGIAVNEGRGEICVGNARNFTTNGEVVCFATDGRERFRFPTRLNPGSIAFRE